MSWDVGVIKGQLPPGATTIDEIAGEPLPLATRAEVHATLAQLLPGYDASNGWPGNADFDLEIYVEDQDPVRIVSFTPPGDQLCAIEPVFAFAERFGASVFAFSDCSILTPESAALDFGRFRQWRNRVLSSTTTPRTGNGPDSLAR